MDYDVFVCILGMSTGLEVLGGCISRGTCVRVWSTALGKIIIASRSEPAVNVVSRVLVKQNLVVKAKRD